MSKLLHRCIALVTVAVGPGCATEPAAAPAQPPRIVFEALEHDAGAVDQGDRIRHDFVFRNGGGLPLRISDVRPACACSVEVSGDAVVAPRTASAIAVEIPTDLLAHQVERTFTVFSNDPQRPATQLKVRATVEPQIIVAPTQLYVGPVARGARAEAMLGLEFPGRANARAIAVKPRGWIARPFLASSGRQVGLAIAATAEPGPFVEKIALRTDHPRRPLVEVVVAGVVTAPSE